MKKSYKIINSVVKTFEIIRFISDQGMKGATPQEVSLAVGIPIVTVMNHLATLESQKIIRPSGRNGFVLGEALAMMWAAAVTDLKRSRAMIGEKLFELKMKDGE